MMSSSAPVLSTLKNGFLKLINEKKLPNTNREVMSEKLILFFFSFCSQVECSRDAVMNRPLTSSKGTNGRSRGKTKIIISIYIFYNFPFKVNSMMSFTAPVLSKMMIGYLTEKFTSFQFNYYYLWLRIS